MIKMNLVNEKYKRFWLEKFFSFFVSVKMILLATGTIMLIFNKITGDNYVALVLGITGAYGLNKVTETWRKLPKSLSENTGTEGD